MGYVTDYIVLTVKLINNSQLKTQNSNKPSAINHWPSTNFPLLFKEVPHTPTPIPANCFYLQEINSYCDENTQL